MPRFATLLLFCCLSSPAMAGLVYDIAIKAADNGDGAVDLQARLTWTQEVSGDFVFQGTGDAFIESFVLTGGTAFRRGYTEFGNFVGSDLVFLAGTVDPSTHALTFTNVLGVSFANSGGDILSVRIGSLIGLSDEISWLSVAANCLDCSTWNPTLTTTVARVTEPASLGLLAVGLLGLGLQRRRSA